MFFDTHNHSQFSFDGEHTTVEKSARAAIDLGFGGICFSDHTDFFIPPDNERQGEGVTEVFDVPAQQAEIDRVNSVIREGKVDFEFPGGLPSGPCHPVQDATLFHLSFPAIIRGKTGRRPTAIIWTCCTGK